MGDHRLVLGGVSFSGVDIPERILLPDGTHTFQMQQPIRGKPVLDKFGPDPHDISWIRGTHALAGRRPKTFRNCPTLKFEPQNPRPLRSKLTCGARRGPEPIIRGDNKHWQQGLGGHTRHLGVSVRFDAKQPKARKRRSPAAMLADTPRDTPRKRGVKP